MIEAADLLPDRGAGIANASGLPRELPGQLDDSLDPNRACQQFLHIHEAPRRPTQ